MCTAAPFNLYSTVEDGEVQRLGIFGIQLPDPALVIGGTLICGKTLLNT